MACYAVRISCTTAAIRAGWDRIVLDVCCAMKVASICPTRWCMRGAHCSEAMPLLGAQRGIGKFVLERWDRMQMIPGNLMY